MWYAPGPGVSLFFFIFLYLRKPSIISRFLFLVGLAKLAVPPLCLKGFLSINYLVILYLFGGGFFPIFIKVLIVLDLNPALHSVLDFNIYGL